MKPFKDRYIVILQVVGKIFFVLYLAFLIWFLIITDLYGRGDVPGAYRYNIVLFTEIRRFWEYRHSLGFFAMFTNIFGNVLIFIPFGFFMTMASQRHSFLRPLMLSFGLSLCIEVFQFFSQVGAFDVDDLFLNTIGGVLGYLIFVIANAIRHHYIRTHASESDT